VGGERVDVGDHGGPVEVGARGDLVGQVAGQDEIERAITAVASGEVIFGPGIARQVLAYFAAPRPAQPTFPELTTRERQVLDLVAAGLSNATIATRLGLSTKTVGNHTSTIFAKLQVADRARQAGLGRT
jgi:DNA-binding NarL/FixJ family response regulator